MKTDSYFDNQISKHKGKVKNLVQICNVFGNADVLKEHTRFTRNMGGEVIAVSGIWPRITWGKSSYSNSSKFLNPTDQLDNVKEMCEDYGFHFIQYDDFTFSGTQYNLALDYINDHNIPMDCLLWIEGDEAINIDNVDEFVLSIVRTQSESVDAALWEQHMDLLPQKKKAITKVRNQGLFFGEACQIKRRGGFDGHLHIDQRTSNFKYSKSCGFLPEDIIHLHMFKEHSLCRINNGVFWTGGFKAKIEDLEEIVGSDYIDFLFSRYEIKSEAESGRSTYIGSSFLKQVGE